MTVHEPVGAAAQIAAMTAAPPLTRPSAEQQWHAQCPACHLEALAVHCPICDAAPGQPCEDAVSGWVQRIERPHLYRIEVAQEVAR